MYRIFQKKYTTFANNNAFRIKQISLHFAFYTKHCSCGFVFRIKQIDQRQIQLRMETLFENSYVRNKELAKEIYRYYYFQRKWLIVCYVLLLLSFLVNILVSIFEKTYNWGVCILVPLFFLFQLYCYFRQVNTMVKRDSEVHGKEISVETIVTNEYIQNTASTGAVNKLEYDKIRNSVQTKNLILLHIALLKGQDKK